ncbi:DNA gyrase subunit B, novobiocin-resistant [Rubripirellula amarantea]|uniref:DNA topoisomerase (ATP-hydrolyzing) n=1 Tax=Rubripirellula amarantea TaxID=2527999 RepID=A0A5C5WFZ6_9BACT|nr:toprim domain-containing protein [Rubripirellula amarantea]TWT49570.1 DNA gyrase subunit B, novobiocin-resistant [Rubripirellula amarantea]
MFPRLPIKLHDCYQHGVGTEAEIFIVEGDSASKAAVRARSPRTQAVLPMQGKPLNAWKASRSAVAKNELYLALIDALGAGWGETFNLASLRYERVTLLFDPDADGIHCGALALMFFYRWMRPALQAGRIGVVRPPVYEIASLDRSEVLHAYSEDHYQKIKAALDEKNAKYHTQKYRGLASMNESALVATCIDPATRNRSVCDCKDAEAAIRVFGGQLPK